MVGKADFPESQKTGVLAELAVQAKFASWNWNSGRDLIDVGYDLCVQPSHAHFHGARFLVQVKGTARRPKKKLVARVSKDRLRQYATNVVPVFVIRVYGDAMYWVHAQAWCNENAKLLSGEGDAGVVFDPSRRLDDCQSFSAYLARILTPPAKVAGAVVDLARERANYLSTLDPCFAVNVEVVGDREKYTLSPRPGVCTPSPFEFIASEGQAAAVGAALKLHSEFGLPAEFDVEAIRSEASSLFKEMGASTGPGRVTLLPSRARTARMSLRAGSGRDRLAPEFTASMQHYSGSVGALLRSEEGAVINCAMKLTPDGNRTRGDVTLSVNTELLDGIPLREVPRFGELMAWADAASISREISIDLVLKGSKEPFRTSTTAQEFAPILHWLTIATRAFEISRFANSDFKLTSELEGSERDVWSIRTGYALLRGERVAVRIHSITADVTRRIPSDVSEFYISTSLSVQFGGREIASLAALIILEGFRQEQVEPNRLQLVSTPGSSAWMEYRHGEIGDSDVLQCKSPVSTSSRPPALT